MSVSRAVSETQEAECLKELARLGVLSSVDLRRLDEAGTGEGPTALLSRSGLMREGELVLLLSRFCGLRVGGAAELERVSRPPLVPRAEMWVTRVRAQCVSESWEEHRSVARGSIIVAWPWPVLMNEVNFFQKWGVGVSA